MMVTGVKRDGDYTVSARAPRAATHGLRTAHDQPQVEKHA